MRKKMRNLFLMKLLFYLFNERNRNADHVGNLVYGKIRLGQKRTYGIFLFFCPSLPDSLLVPHLGQLFKIRNILNFIQRRFNID